MTAIEYGPGPGIGAPVCMLDQSARLAETRRATLAAELAIGRYELKRTAVGRFILRRCGLTRAMDSRDAVARFAREVGVQHG